VLKVMIMENLNKNTKVSSPGKIIKKTKVEHPECDRVIKYRKAVLSKKTEKTYKVTVTYIEISDEEARIKRAIIENIIKKSYKNQNLA